MTAASWERLETIFAQAMELPPPARAGFLDGACDTDAVLRAEIEAMLAAHEAAPPLAIERLVVDAADPWLGQRLGPWRLIRTLGHGGMGVVYVAERADGEYQLEAAVKLLRTGSRDPAAIERFRTERQVLASLDHPHIAGLLDGGFAPDGTPYLVMELVDGLPLSEWCRARRLSLDERLRLVRAVCDAVQHAHRALVVHRDLKPGNILVSSSGAVKLLDFGIAKLLEPAAWGLAAADTRAEMRVLTPDYAAPEQRQGGPITTATDVYALGVLLYQIVADARPGSPLTAPSDMIRRAGHRTLARRVRGDLDRIILMALRDEPARRYVSAGQLGEELDRFLGGRPVLAQPDTWRYRARKFAVRNRAAVAAAAVVMAGLAAFGGFSAWQARVLAEQRQIAQLERDTANQVVRVLIDLFQSTNPSIRPDGDRVPVGEFLQAAQARSLESLSGVPAVRAKLQQVFGLIHQTRGQYAAARQVLEDALEQQQRLAGPDDEEALETLQTLAEVSRLGGDNERGLALLEDSLERHRRVYGDDHVKTARVLHALAPAVAARDLDRAGEMLERSLDIRRRALGPRHPSVAESLQSLGGYNFFRDRYDASRSLYEQALAVFPTAEERRNPVAISILGDYGNLLNALQAYGEAAAVQRQVIDLGRQVLGPESITLANQLNNLGASQSAMGRHADAERSYREAHAMHRSLVGETHERTRNVARNIARSLEMQQRDAESLEWFDRAIALPPGQPPDTGGPFMRAQRAMVLARLGRADEALAEIGEAIDSLQRWAGETNLTLANAGVAGVIANARILRGRLLLALDRPHDAEADLAAAFQWYERSAPTNLSRAEAACQLARARLLQRDDAGERQRLAQCLPVYRSWGLADVQSVAALERLIASAR